MLTDFFTDPHVESAIKFYSLKQLERLFLANNFYVFNTDTEWRDWRQMEFDRLLVAGGNDHLLPNVSPKDDPVTHAISLSRLDRINFMLRCGLPAHSWTKTSWSPLAVALLYEEHGCFDLLCNSLPNVDVPRLRPGLLRESPPFLLTLAGTRANEYAFERLLDHRDEYNQNNPAVLTPIMNGHAIYQMIRCFRVPLIARAADAGIRLSGASHETNNEGPWHVAPDHPDTLALIQLLARECPHRLFQPDRYMQTALFPAVRSRKAAVVQRYIDRGIDVGHEVGSGETALHYALRQRPVALDVLRILLQHIHVDTSAGSGQGTPLHTLLLCTFAYTWRNVNYIETYDPDGSLCSRRQGRGLTKEEKEIEDIACQACDMILGYFPDRRFTDAQGRTTLEMTRLFGLKRMYHRISNAPISAEHSWERRLRRRLQ
ncbi:uncharacterized protein BDW43DRAFT_301870 [Aspergillus alliaceus]|uniref:uncharacterized protein n=1 Tax=Petromyces alliaceus TaxID=209559 RepID=UPI0012A470E2|nr:uncharacterized protein BDW43DRAFT_301870 [Aspergillus alliaceus]KAB8231185.1 hypothetical protein BDW43DRAFT_301870 [Aspergillus alliaceus]